MLRYIRFLGIIHPATLDASHVASFLTHLATARNVAAKTQQQALNAAVFLCRDVLRQPVAEPIAARPVRAEAVGWRQRRSAACTALRPSNFGP
ncbi:MAG: phage integrase N-terminal SAM-like domain-containing protein [Rhodothermales bacterium]|nr:phage integrase N-terminal SAM-like domain-containing protein [Rhodothermales bacterium]